MEMVSPWHDDIGIGMRHEPLFFRGNDHPTYLLPDIVGSLSLPAATGLEDGIIDIEMPTESVSPQDHTATRPVTAAISPFPDAHGHGHGHHAPTSFPPASMLSTPRHSRPASTMESPIAIVKRETRRHTPPPVREVAKAAPVPVKRKVAKPVISARKPAAAAPPPPKPKPAPVKVIEEEAEVACICKEAKGGALIACDGAQCDVEWYHMACLGLNSAPDGEWLCPRCDGSPVPKKPCLPHNKGGACPDCGVTRSNQWRKGDRWGVPHMLCNPCGLYRKRHNGARRPSGHSRAAIVRAETQQAGRHTRQESAAAAAAAGTAGSGRALGNGRATSNSRRSRAEDAENEGEDSSASAESEYRPSSREGQRRNLRKRKHSVSSERK